MKATSQFGVEYDSLADLISFGVAPAFLLYSFRAARSRPSRVVRRVSLRDLRALRLARFNVITGSSDKRYFIGLPIPAGAAVACSVVILLHGEDLARWMRVSVAIVTYLVALLMVSTFRYWSFKSSTGEAPARSHAADRRPGRDDRGHEARGVPLPRVRRLRGLRAGAAAVVGHTPAPTLSEVLGKEHS